MIAESYKQPAEARCYKCGSPEIEGICHHCGRGMCKSHSQGLDSDTLDRLPVSLGLWNALLIQFGFKSLEHDDFSQYEPGFARLSVLDELLTKVGLARVVNTEFSGYIYDYPPLPADGLLKSLGYRWRRFTRLVAGYWGNLIGKRIHTEGKEVRSFHCEFCAHSVTRYPALMWIGTLLTLSLVGAILGIPLLILGFWLNQKRYIEAQISQLTPIPLEGRVGKVEVSETITGHIQLDANGNYSMSQDSRVGKLTLPLNLDIDERERYRAYMQKIQELGASVELQDKVSMGYLELGPAQREYSAGEIWMPGRVNIVEMNAGAQDSRIAGLLYDPEQSEARWQMEHAYRYDQIAFITNKHRATLPFQVVVAIRPESDRKALDIALELIDLDLPGAKDATIERFVLWVPNSLGGIERVDPEGKIEENASDRDYFNGEYESITWKKLKFSSNKKGNGRKGDDLRCPLYIQFKGKIDPTVRLEGEVELTVPTSLSGPSRPRMFFPWGDLRREKLDYDAKTTLKLTLDLDLSGLRYQKLITDDALIIRQGIIPDSELIAKIVSTLSEQDFYIKRITENPARAGKEGAHKIKRYWDLAGRKYEGVYPVDLHLVLTGEEFGAEGRASIGQLKVTISVQGSVTNEEMEQRVKNVCEQLNLLICQVVDDMHFIQSEPAALSDGIGQGAGNNPEQVIDYSYQTQGIPVQVLESDQPGVEILKNIVPEGEVERLKELQRRLDKLEERFVDGDIQTDDYHELKSRYEQEIWDITNGEMGKNIQKINRRKGTRK